MTLTEELALKQAAEADKEIAAGKYRGPLHGIPWVAKDLIAYPGYPTTWGAGHFKEQTFDTKATVAARLDEAGAVLVAKTTLGSLAVGDRWFGGMTRNPWNVKTGSQRLIGGHGVVGGGGAGRRSASAARRSAASSRRAALRRDRAAADVRPREPARVHDALLDASTRSARWPAVPRTVPWCSARSTAPTARTRRCRTGRSTGPATRPLKELRVGYQEGRGGLAADDDMKVLKELGVKLVPITLPHAAAQNIVTLILDVESATAFDDITRAGVNDGIGACGRTPSAGRGSSRRSITCAPSERERC